MDTVLLETMTLQHPRWREFCCKLEERLAGRENEAGHWVTICDGGEDKRLARATLEEMGNFDIPATFAYFEMWGGYCDCEIIFNVDC